jgi:hypothetical protein
VSLLPLTRYLPAVRQLLVVIDSPDLFVVLFGYTSGLILPVVSAHSSSYMAITSQRLFQCHRSRALFIFPHSTFVSMILKARILISCISHNEVSHETSTAYPLQRTLISFPCPYSPILYIILTPVTPSTHTQTQPQNGRSPQKKPTAPPPSSQAPTSTPQQPSPQPSSPSRPSPPKTPP